MPSKINHKNDFDEWTSKDTTLPSEIRLNKT